MTFILNRKKGKFPSGYRRKIWVRDKEKCFYCRCKLKLSKATIDHRIPIIKGGDDREENLVIACFNCNNDKGAFTDHEYFAILKERCGS
jgi:5-methylcytosine-specific restriction endonuclease McrA